MTNSLGSLNGPSRTSARTVNAPDRESSTARVAQSCIGDHDRPPHRLDIPEPLLSDSVPGACHCQVQSHGPCPCHCRVKVTARARATAGSKVTATTWTETTPSAL